MLQHRQGHHEGAPQLPQSGLAPNSFTEGAAPTLTPDAAAGVGATAAFGGSGVADDNSGVVTLTPEGAPAAGSQLTVTFASPFPARAVVLTPANAAAAGVAADIFAGLVYPIGSTDAVDFVIGSTAALVAGTTYAWNYIVL